MKVNFRNYQGLAGELDTLLICESICGHSISRLYSTQWPFKIRKLRFAKYKLKREMELLTGQKIRE
jgi:hypothetical protein